MPNYNDPRYLTRKEIEAIIEKWRVYRFDFQRVIHTEVYNHERTVEVFLTREGGERRRLVLLVKPELAASPAQ